MAQHTGGGDSMTRSSGKVIRESTKITGDAPTTSLGCSVKAESKLTTNDRGEGHGEQKPSATTTDTDDNKEDLTTGSPDAPLSPVGGISWRTALSRARRTKQNEMSADLRNGCSR
jgi:hypothetical protein